MSCRHVLEQCPQFQLHLMSTRNIHRGRHVVVCSMQGRSHEPIQCQHVHIMCPRNVLMGSPELLLSHMPDRHIFSFNRFCMHTMSNWILESCKRQRMYCVFNWNLLRHQSKHMQHLSTRHVFAWQCFQLLSMSARFLEFLQLQFLQSLYTWNVFWFKSKHIMHSLCSWDSIKCVWLFSMLSMSCGNLQQLHSD